MSVYAIALNTFREARRDRAQWILVLYVGMILGGAFVLSPLALGESYRITRDIGLAAISIVGVILIVLIGAGMVQKEVDKRTVLTVLAKPIHRPTFLLGKYLGMMAMVTMVFVSMLAILCVTLLIQERHIEPAVLLAGLYTFGELAILTAVVVMFSSFVTPALTAIFTVAVFALGHFAADLLRFADTAPTQFAALGARGFYLMLPHFDMYNLRTEAAYSILPDPMQGLWAAAYAVCYTACMLALGSALFSRREFR